MGGGGGDIFSREPPQLGQQWIVGLIGRVEPKLTRRALFHVCRHSGPFGSTESADGESTDQLWWRTGNVRHEREE